MAFDIIGDIVILKPPLKYEPEEYVKLILEKHKFVKTILLQETDVQPPYRIANYKILWGENKTETIHKEFGLKFKVDVTKAYFSQRLSNERYRIAKQVKENEEVLVMFSGINPYPIYIEKFSNPKIIYSIELNPFAVKYGLENVKINKCKKIITILGDVRDVCPLINLFQNNYGFLKTEENYLLDLIESGIELDKIYFRYPEDKNLLELINKIKSKKKGIIIEGSLRELGQRIYQYDEVILRKNNKIFRVILKDNLAEELEIFSKKFDRIIMPLPKEADTFLDVAIPCIKEGGIIHLYQFMKEEEIPNAAYKILDKYSKELGFEYEILEVRKIGDIAPKQYRVCIDFRVIKRNI